MRVEIKMKGWKVQLRNAQKVEQKDREMGEKKAMGENPGDQHPTTRDSKKNMEGRKSEEKKYKKISPKGMSFQNKGPTGCPVPEMQITMKF